MNKFRCDRFEFDIDWKPEPEEPAISGDQDDRPSGPQSLLAPGVSRTPYKGALTIIEYATVIPQFEVIRDTDKFLMRFPFGGVKIPGEEPDAGSRRESREEVGLRLGKLTRDNFIGELSCGPNCTHFAFAKRLPAEAKDRVKLGPEQKDHAAMLERTIDRCIEEGLFSKNHANAWRIFKKWRVGKTY